MPRTYFPPQSRNHFGAVLEKLVIERGDYLKRSGEVNWAWFIEAVPKIHYETLRKAINGERWPSNEMMETVAGSLGVEPEVFGEYRLNQFLSQFDVTRQGFDAALDALDHWTSLNTKAPVDAPKSDRRTRSKKDT